MSTITEQPPITEGQPGDEYEIAPEDRTTLDTSMPMLQVIRKHTIWKPAQQITAILPTDFSVYPAASVGLTSYAGKRSDPPEVGAWQVVIGKDVNVLLQTSTSPQYPQEYSFHPFGATDRNYMYTADDIHSIATVIGYLSEQWAAAVNTKV